MLDAPALREVLDYDPETGEFAWKIRRRGIVPGRMPGCINKFGYRVIRIDGELYLAHRLAWLYVYGEWPTNGHVDHINHDPADNRIDNLRDVTVAQNITNRSRANKNSTTGVLGVNPLGSRWIARIMRDRRNVHLGVFDTIDEASAVVAAARAEVLMGA